LLPPVVTIWTRMARSWCLAKVIVVVLGAPLPVAKAVVSNVVPSIEPYSAYLLA
jgi:hypothetical protein